MATDADRCSAAFPERHYRRKTDLNGDFHKDRLPDLTHYVEYPWTPPHDPKCHFEDMVATVCNAKALGEKWSDVSKSGATLLGCHTRDCQKKTTRRSNVDWECQGCCVTEWSDLNKADCCDPQGNDLQKSGLHCHPTWCPWSSSCVREEALPNVAERYRAYCLSHPTDARCLEACLLPTDTTPTTTTTTTTTTTSLPTWCYEFMPRYCAAQTPDGHDWPTEDRARLLCYCQTQKTGADECLVVPCVQADPKSTWLTPQQLQHRQEPQYCTKVCQAQGQQLEQTGVAQVGWTDFPLVCPQVPLKTLDQQAQQEAQQEALDDWTWKDYWDHATPAARGVVVALGLVVGLVVLGGLWWLVGRSVGRPPRKPSAAAAPITTPPSTQSFPSSSTPDLLLLA